eukprot:5757180-Pleurochrysis_carterae.AAC.3
MHLFPTAASAHAHRTLLSIRVHAHIELCSGRCPSGACLLGDCASDATRTASGATRCPAVPQAQQAQEEEDAQSGPQQAAEAAAYIEACDRASCRFALGATRSLSTGWRPAKSVLDAAQRCSSEMQLRMYSPGWAKAAANDAERADTRRGAVRAFLREFCEETTVSVTASSTDDCGGCTFTPPTPQ